MKKVLLFILITGLMLTTIPLAMAKSAYVVVKGDVVNELSLSLFDVEVYGEVKNLNLGTGKITIHEGGKVKNLSLGMGDVIILGEAGEIKVGLGDVEVSGKVRGDIEVGLGDVILKSTAIVEGDISTVGEITRDEGSIVEGAVKSVGITIPGLKGIFKDRGYIKKIPARLFQIHQTMKLISLISTLLLGVLLLALFPLAVQRGAEFLISKPWNSLLLTLSLTVIAIGGTFFLVITLIGIPLALLIWSTFIIFNVLGGVIVYRTTGEMLLKVFKLESPVPALSYIVGAIPLLLLRNYLPFGFIIGLAVFLFGLGSAFKAAFPKANIFGL